MCFRRRLSSISYLSFLSIAVQHELLHHRVQEISSWEKLYNTHQNTMYKKKKNKPINQILLQQPLPMININVNIYLNNGQVVSPR